MAYKPVIVESAGSEIFSLIDELSGILSIESALWKNFWRHIGPKIEAYSEIETVSKSQIRL